MVQGWEDLLADEFAINSMVGLCFGYGRITKGGIGQYS